MAEVPFQLSLEGGRLVITASLHQSQQVEFLVIGLPVVIGWEGLFCHIEGFYEMRRCNDYQFRLVLLKLTAPEQGTQDGDIA
jgi:hypothetical protein